MITVFVICFAGAIYSYFLYPLLLAGIVALRGRGSGARGEVSSPPRLTLIIAAHNEAAGIREKLDNSLAIAWPELEIIVASDGSTDATNEIVRSYAGRGVKLVAVPEQHGKEFAQQQAILQATGEIVVFSDSGTRIEPDGLERLAAWFADRQIGAVSSTDRFISASGELAGEGAYVRYEMAVRGLESELGGLIGLSGSFFAVRREICEDWDLGAPSDFNCALNCARRGLKAVSAGDVFGYYRDLEDSGAEYRRKVRTILRGITGLMRHLGMMSPVRYGFFGWQLASHKLMRWLVPFFLIGLFATSLALAERFLTVRWLLIGQIGFYGLAAAAHFSSALRQFSIARLVYFFCLVNVATLHAWWRYVTGQRVRTWQPSVR